MPVIYIGITGSIEQQRTKKKKKWNKGKHQEQKAGENSTPVGVGSRVRKVCSKDQLSRRDHSY